jgi:hypothetical protein
MRVLTSTDGERDLAVAIEQRDAARYWAASLEEDAARALRMVEVLSGALSRFTHEYNPGSFEPDDLCWSCGGERSEATHHTTAYLRLAHGLER